MAMYAALKMRVGGILLTPATRVEGTLRSYR